MSNRSKKVAAFIVGLTSSLAVTGFLAKSKMQGDICSCDDQDCNCHDKPVDVHIPEPSVKKVSRVRKLGKREHPGGKNEVAKRVDAIKAVFEDIKEKSLPNESIAKIVMSLINLQNAVEPEEAVDVRSIHFMRSGKQNTMVIDFYTGHFGKKKYEDQLDRIWRDVFLAEDFWDADFVKVRIGTKDVKTGKSLESVSCSLDDVKRYLLGKISGDEFKACWTRRKAKSMKKESSPKDKKVRNLKRA